jgi:hypothetical protein
MLHGKFPLVLATLAALPLHADAAGALSCKSGYTHATITKGSAVTVNVSQVKQVGQLCLTMADDHKRVVFDDCGALVGTVTATDDQGQPTKLSHTAVFELFESFKTQDDQVVYAAPVDPYDAAPCAFNIGEALTQLQWGTGPFYGGSIRASADGVVSFCPQQNRNTFVITGEACLRLH